mgnify:CR=1 FL=1
MIVKDLTEFQNEKGNVTFVEQVRAIFEHGFSWRKAQKDQETFITMIESILSDDCFLLRNVKLPGVEKPIPLVLIAPAGISVINPQSIEGTYQAKEDVLLSLDSKGDLVPESYNPLRETLSYTNALRTYFERHNHEDLPLSGVLALTSAAAHVDSKRSSVRILPVDAIQNFAREIGASRSVFSREEKIQYIKLLVQPRPPAHSTPYPEREDSPPSPADTSEIVRRLNAISENLNFSKRQWIFLGVFLVAEVLVLIAFIILILITS